MINLITDYINLYRKSGMTKELEVCQLIKAAFIENQHSKKPEPEIEVLRKMIKVRNKAIEMYFSRPDLAEKEKFERDFIQKFIPAEPTESELTEFIKEYIGNRQISMADTNEIWNKAFIKFPTTQKSTVAKILKTLIN